MASKPEKISLEQLIRLVHQLTLEDQEKLRLTLNFMAEGDTSSAAKEHAFLDWRANIDSLAAQQGVPESTSVADLKGDFWPEDEDLTEFVSTIRQWRQESSEQK